MADELTLDKLVPAWAKELSGANSSVRLEWEDWLWYWISAERLGQAAGQEC
jgi:hypothetical protein